MRFFVVIFLSVILFSCKGEQKEKLQKNKVFAQKIDNEKIHFTGKIVPLHVEAKKKVANWQEYQALAEFIPKFYKTATKEVLFNSNQLETLTRFLKDSIRIKDFNTPSFKIRLNVLHSEAMRLFDMDSIPSITNKEVIHENNNVIEAFNAVNMKINSIVKRNILVNDLSEFDYLFKDNDAEKKEQQTEEEEERMINFENKIPLEKRRITSKGKNEKRKAINKRIQPLSIKKHRETKGN